MKTLHLHPAEANVPEGYKILGLVCESPDGDVHTNATVLSAIQGASAHIHSPDASLSFIGTMADAGLYLGFESDEARDSFLANLTKKD